MNLTKIAFTYRKSILMVLALLLINGIFAYLTLPAQENPTITIRKAIVTTSYPGMAPERVEQLITRAIENPIIRAIINFIQFFIQEASLCSAANFLK